MEKVLRLNVRGYCPLKAWLLGAPNYLFMPQELL